AHLIPAALEGIDRDRYLQQRQRHLEQGFPERLAEYLAALEALAVAVDLSELALETRSSARDVARVHFALSARLSLDWLHAAIEQLATTGDWQRSAKRRLQEMLLAAHLRLSALVLTRARSRESGTLEAPALQRWQQLITELQAL